MDVTALLLGLVYAVVVFVLMLSCFLATLLPVLQWLLVALFQVVPSGCGSLFLFLFGWFLEAFQDSRPWVPPGLADFV